MRSFGILMLALWLAGCSSLPWQKPPEPPTPGGTSDATPTGEPLVRALEVTVLAPRPLRQLLEQHLDVIRLGELAAGERLDSTEIDRLVAALPLQVNELMETEGYFDPTLKIEREGQRLTLNISPGTQARIGRVTVEIQGELLDMAAAGDSHATTTLAAVRGAWALPSGAPFRNASWSDAKADLMARLRAAGFAAASWTGTAADVDTTAAEVRLFVVADSGPLFRSGVLDIRGLAHHDAETVQHLAGFDVGTPLTEALLLDFQDRLRQSSLFDSVAVSFEADASQAAAAPVRVRLRESARQLWTLGAGISANTGARASVEHLHRRPLGWPAIARNKLELGGLRQAWDGEISTHPLERQYRWLLGGAVERLESNDDLVSSQRLRFGRALNTARVDRLAFIETEHSARRLFDSTAASQDSRETALTVNYHGVWRRLDDNLLPTRGYALSLQAGLGHSQSNAADSGYFSRWYGRLTVYRPVGDGWFGQARVELGQVLRPAGVAVPDSQQFRAGGDASVRGYSYRSLGPLVDGLVDSGDALFSASVELARPIVPELPSVWGAVFVDIGRAANNFGDLRPALGTGVGVRWRSPVGPLRLDLAWGEEQRRLRMHFSVGVSF